MNFKNVIMYPRWRLAVEKICDVKITKLANYMGRNGDVCLKFGRSIPQSVLIATVKAS